MDGFRLASVPQEFNGSPLSIAWSWSSGFFFGPASLCWNVTYGLNSFGCGWRERGASFSIQFKPTQFWIHTYGTVITSTPFGNGRRTKTSLILDLPASPKQAT
jgi:hypothetical protein